MNKTINLQSMSEKGLLFGVMMVVIFFVLFIGIQNASATITSQLDFGSSGSDVVELQAYLATNADIYPSGFITGCFDSLTQSAMQKFQTAQRIVFNGTPETTGYGRVGPKTLIRLNAIIDFIPKNSIHISSMPLVGNEVSFLKPGQAVFGLPVRLKIPGISVDSVIEPVCLTPEGAMYISKSQENVAWFELGPRPGENGSAVIAGHYDGRENGRASVFDNLYKLRQGDKLYVEDDKGVITAFVVRESRRYDSDADASDIFDSNDGKAHLNIITCDGVWNQISKNYPNRLVVFTDKE
ncbi:MAG: sortase [Patescibacteria group bacterium]|jgi:LPXTG-site transpeptidase (sortase) family protein